MYAGEYRTDLCGCYWLRVIYCEWWFLSTVSWGHREWPAFFLSRWQCIQLDAGRKNIVAYRNSDIFVLYHYGVSLFVSYYLSIRLYHCPSSKESLRSTQRCQRQEKLCKVQIPVHWTNNIKTMKLPVLLTLLYCFCVDVSHTREITYVPDQSITWCIERALSSDKNVFTAC